MLNVLLSMVLVAVSVVDVRIAWTRDTLSLTEARECLS